MYVASFKWLKIAKPKHIIGFSVVTLYPAVIG